MHTTHSNTQYKNESSTVKWAQWDKIQSRELLVCSYVCASHCAQLLHTILHRTDLIVFPLTLQTITTARMMSIWGKGGWQLTHTETGYKLCKFCENRARDTPLRGIYIPHFDQILVKISVLGLLYPNRCTDWGEIWRGLHAKFHFNLHIESMETFDTTN